MSGLHSHRSRGGFVENTIEGLRAAMNRALHADQTSGQRGLMQRLDPRVKVAGLTGLILVSALATKLWVAGGVLAVAAVLGLLSGLSLWALMSRVWIAALTFSAALAAPALFLTPGAAVFRLPELGWEITSQGLTTASFLVLRAEASATLALILVFTTPWMHVLKALRTFRVPVVFIVILGMACRYILLLLETAHEMFESRKSRTVGFLTRSEQRRVAILSTGALLSRSLQLSNEVYLAMQARGFRGEVYVLDDFEMRAADWFALVSFGGVAAALTWAGR